MSENKDDSVKLSIALATYNGARFLRDQLDSLLAQTVAFDELVVCDDCSADSTLDILAEYAARDPRIRIIANESNLGFRANFEKALRLCRGELIALCDQDDIWVPRHLEVLRDSIGRNLLVAGGSDVVDRNCCSHGRSLAFVKNFEFHDPDPIQVFRFVAFYQNPFQGAAMMMRREFLDVALPISDTVRYHDVWFATVASLMESFRFVDSIVTLYRIHGDNASGSHCRKARVRTLAGHLLKRDLGNNRVQLVEALAAKRGAFPARAQKCLDEACRYYASRSLSRRLANLLYELKHYDDIYGRPKHTM